MEFLSCLEKHEEIKKGFLLLKTREERYQKIIELGQRAPKMPLEDQTEANLVPGCQSLLYLKVQSFEERMHLQASSDALISAGLAQLIVQAYNGEPVRAVFYCPPYFLKELGLLESLSPSRANGLKSLYQKLQKDSLKFLALT